MNLNHFFLIKLNQKIKNLQLKNNNYKLNKTSLLQKQLYSFIGAYINHPSIRSEIADELNRSKLLDDSLTESFTVQFLNQSLLS